MAKQMVFELAAILLVPAAVFWILYRFGFFKILDALAIAVLIAVLALLVLRFLMKQKVFSFGGMRK